MTVIAIGPPEGDLQHFRAVPTSRMEGPKMGKKQRAEDQITTAQKRKLIELWDAGYELDAIVERFGVSVDTVTLIVGQASAQRRAAAQAGQSISESYRAFLRAEIERQIG